ncbi:MAG: DNA translocase FtsK [Oscillospiraceae bacterium]|nr:DNA translocase FtsK [Oscillospiraceae bacterium]
MAGRTAAKPKKPNKKEPAAASGAKKQMWAVILFALGILLGALTFIEGDRLWRTIHNLLFGMFGISAYFWAPLLVYIAVIAAMEKPLSSVKAKVWQVSLLILVLAGAFTIFGPGLPGEETFVDNIIALYATGQLPGGGGLAGAVFAFPLLFFFERTGASIIISLLIFVLAMLITGSTLIGLIRAARKPVEGLEESFAEKMQERGERREAATQKKMAKQAAKETKAAKSQPVFTAFDVDISEDTVVSPDHPVFDDPPIEIHPAAPSFRPAQAFREDHVEFIPAEQLQGAAAEIEAEPVHPLEEDILSAERREEKQEIFEIVDRFVGQAAEPGWEEAVPEPVMEPIVYPTATPPAPLPPPEYIFPPTTLLQAGTGPSSVDVSEELKNNAQTLVDTLKSFGVQTRITDICRGPSVTRYELQPSAGVKISKITGLADDIALNLATAGIRIEAPIPNKAAVGVEVPNKNVSMVNIREMIESVEFTSSAGVLTIALGKDIAGNIILADIGKMPHVLIAGSTGSGKSVCINSIIMSLLYKYTPDEVKLLLVDPKVVELGVYNGIPHLLVPVVTEPKKAAGALGWAVSQMMERYKLFAANGVKDLAGYNRLAAERENLEAMPKMVIVIDELADLMMAAPSEVEDNICRLAQMARAAGMHLVIATQRPSVDVITGIIKANVPSRIAFAVSSQVDSRTILDMGGAEKLLGRGDMLFYPVGVSKPVRVQGCFVTEPEVESVIGFIKESAAVDYDKAIIEEIDRHAVVTKGKGGASDPEAESGEDEMLPQAIECVVEAGQASTSQLQRRLKLGYARAARIIDQLEQKGIVGPFEGSKPRQVMISKERWMEMRLAGAETAMLNQTRKDESFTAEPNSSDGDPPFDLVLPHDDPVISLERGGVKARPDEFEFADL